MTLLRALLPALAATALLATACTNDTRDDACPGGAVVDVDGVDICVTDTRVIVETGFLCAEEYPERYDRPPYIACGPDGLSDDVVDAAIAAYEAATGATSDAGADASTSDAGADEPGADAAADAAADAGPGDAVADTEDGRGRTDAEPATCVSDDDCDPSETCLSGICLGCTDEDGDGWCVERGDCEDDNPDVNPGAEEILRDGVDNDCDGLVDESR